MAASRLNLVGDLRIEQGANWQHTVRVEASTDVPRDLTGYTARMQIRATLDGEVLLAPSCSIDALQGRITLSLTAAVTGALTLSSAETTWLYDLELVSGAGAVERLLEGRVLVSREVTR